MPRRSRDIARILEHKFGFTRAVGHSVDHPWFELNLPGLPPILTKVSHGNDDVGPRLQGKIARQLRVPNAYLDGMLDCTRSRDDYYGRVRVNPVPPFDIRF